MYDFSVWCDDSLMSHGRRRKKENHWSWERKRITCRDSGVSHFLPLVFLVACDSIKMNPLSYLCRDKEDFFFFQPNVYLHERLIFIVTSACFSWILLNLYRIRSAPSWLESLLQTSWTRHLYQGYCSVALCSIWRSKTLFMHWANRYGTSSAGLKCQRFSVSGCPDAVYADDWLRLFAVRVYVLESKMHVEQNAECQESGTWFPFDGQSSCSPIVPEITPQIPSRSSASF